MIQTYEGYFKEDGYFITHNLVKIPSNRRAIVNILEDEIIDSQIACQQKVERLRKMFEEAGEAENELTDEEWEELENIRSQTNFDRGVEKWFTL